MMTSDRSPSATNSPPVSATTDAASSPKRESLGGEPVGGTTLTTTTTSMASFSSDKVTSAITSDGDKRTTAAASSSSAAAAVPFSAMGSSPLWSSCGNLKIDPDEPPVPKAETNRPTPLRQNSLQSLHSKSPAGVVAIGTMVSPGASANTLIPSPSRKTRNVGVAGRRSPLPPVPRLGQHGTSTPLPLSTTVTTSTPTSSGPPQSLQTIMQEQEEEQEQERQQEQQAQQEAENNDHNELSLDDLRILETAQEEEMIALALERSLTDLSMPDAAGSNHSNLSNHTNNSNNVDDNINSNANNRFRGWAQHRSAQRQQQRQAGTGGGGADIVWDSTRSMNSSRSSLGAGGGGIWDSQQSMSSTGAKSTSSSTTGRPPLRRPPPSVATATAAPPPPPPPPAPPGTPPPPPMPRKTRRPARQHSGTERVLEVARKNLSPREVDLIEAALQAGIRRHSGDIDLAAISQFDGGVAAAAAAARQRSRSNSRDKKPHPLDHLIEEEEEPYDMTNSSSETGVALAALKRHGGDYNDYDELDRPLAATAAAAATDTGNTAAALEYDLFGAEEHLSEEELRQIQLALQGEEDGSPAAAATAEGDFLDSKSPDVAASVPNATPTVTAEEAAAIERAIKEADDAEEARSLQLAFQMQEEEKQQLNSSHINSSVGHQQLPQGKVRTMTRAQWQAEKSGLVESSGGIFGSSSGGGTVSVPIRDIELPGEYDEGKATTAQAISAGFRMNSNTQQEWSRLDQNSIIGPNYEVRTKHDAELHAHANAHRLGVEMDEKTGSMAHVGNQAYNSFRQSMKRNKTKGVATSGTGRAGSDASGTKGGAMDAAVREQISRAINAGIMNKLNGVVKEGKEAVVYHAEKGEGSEGFDVAVKVFKRIQEFKDRAEYVNGDPRYHGIVFQKNSSREQLHIWTEKEYRNLMRASRAGVPVATPLLQKDNILFMRFLGTNGWPAPQLREVDLRKGSKRWAVLYEQVVNAVRNLYLKARLVHGDLSEYNIMVVPAYLVENRADLVETEKSEVQAVLIDFGQAVDLRHPESDTLLHRDLDRIESFFQRQGVETMGLEKLTSFVKSS